jgi:putative transposase
LRVALLPLWRERDVSELMLARGIEVSHEAIRLWTVRFGTEYARRLKRTRGSCSNIWHLDELCLMINRERGWLWRVVDDASECSTCSFNAVEAPSPRSASQTLKGQGMAPCAIVRDRLASYAGRRSW